jgi:hypothetical protein
MQKGDIIKIKLGGDVHEAEVVDCRYKKTIRVKVLWNRTKIHALSPREKQEVARMPKSTEGLGNEEKALALLAQAGKKVVHESGTRIIKIPRARIVSEPAVVATAAPEQPVTESKPSSKDMLADLLAMSSKKKGENS